MFTISDFGFMILIVLTIYSKYVFTIDNHNDSIFKIGDSLGKAITSSSVNIHNTSKTINVSSLDGKPQQTEQFKLGNRISEYSLEGGGLLKQTSSALVNDDHVKSEEESHSKGRKGVAHEGASVVPRKGVDNLEALSVDNVHVVSSLSDSPNTTIGNISSMLNVTDFKQNKTTPLEDVTQQIIQAKKPEVVSDIGDANDYDTYTIIKTSTTGEDYVVIGIVIVIGIWFSVFGALIFYRRAGEYWDRRHYRRMDFLVEGMYND